MPLTITKQQLTKSVQAVIAGYARRFTIAWHEWMLFDFDGVHLTVATGNGNGRCWHNSEIKDAQCAPFRVAVKANEIQQVCQATRSETLTLSHDGNKLHINGERGKLSIACTEEWPSLPSVSDLPVVATLNAAGLAYGVRAALAGTEESSEKFALGSVQINVGASPSVCSADGRLAMRIAVTGTASESQSFLVPKESVAMLSGVLNSIPGDSNVDIRVDGNNVAFSSDNATAYVTQAAGRYPDVIGLIANVWGYKRTTTVDVDVPEVKSAIREAIIGYDTNQDWARSVLFACDGSKLIVLSDAQSPNDMTISVAVNSVDGRGCMVVDHTFVSKIISASGGESVNLSIARQGTACYMLVESGSFRAVIIGIGMTRQDEKSGKEIPTASAIRAANAMDAQPMLV